MKWKVIQNSSRFQSIPVTTNLSGCCLLIGLLSQSQNRREPGPVPGRLSKSVASRLSFQAESCRMDQQKNMLLNIPKIAGLKPADLRCWSPEVHFLPEGLEVSSSLSASSWLIRKTPASIGKQEITSRCSLKPNRSRTHRCVHMSYVLDQPSMIRIWVNHISPEHCGHLGMIIPC